MEQYDVFISFSRKDVAIADRIEKELKKYNISYFIDRYSPVDHDVPFASEIARCIEKCKILLFVWTENSNKSMYTANDIKLAIQYGKTIVPFKIGKFEPDYNLEYYLVCLKRFEANDPNDEQICSMVARFVNQLSKLRL